jgi:hypothetical protein
MPVNGTPWACSKCFVEPGREHETWCTDLDVLAFCKSSPAPTWDAEKQQALDAIPKEFIGNDLWLNGIKRMATEIERLRRSQTGVSRSDVLKELKGELETGLSVASFRAMMKRIEELPESQPPVPLDAVMKVLDDLATEPTYGSFTMKRFVMEAKARTAALAPSAGEQQGAAR